MENIITVDKPSGISSFDVIRRLRRSLGVRKLGHAGTLDPLASGLLIIGVGDGTKKLDQFLKLPKVYEAEVLLGLKTDTGDVTGRTVERLKVPDLSETKISEILGSLVGKLELPVPAYSAIKRGGEALYRKARRGEKFELPVKPMEIFWLKFLGFKGDNEQVIIKIELEVSSGTYIRSIAEEIGRRLEVPATIKSLRRTKIGVFMLKDAEKI